MLAILYLPEEQYRIIRLHFIFSATWPDGTVVLNIADPHGLHLADALPKLQGLAIYAETHANAYGRIESVAEAGGKLRVLDLTNDKVREAIASATNAAILFGGKSAQDY